MTTVNVGKAMKDIKLKNSEGFDRKPQRLLNDGYELLNEPMGKLFELIYNKMEIPDQWRMSKVIQILYNQLNAQIKITEIWKTVHKDNYPIEVKKYILEADERISRSKISDKLFVKGHSDLMKSSYKNDAPKLWNICPDSKTSSNCEIW